MALVRRWPLALVLGLICGGSAALAAWLLLPPPQYSATAILHVASNRPRIIFSTSESQTEFGNYVRTQLTLIKSEDAPKTYDDLTDPQWKGKLGVEADDGNWFMSIAGAMGEDKAVALFRKIVAINGMSLRKGHTLL